MDNALDPQQLPPLTEAEATEQLRELAAIVAAGKQAESDRALLVARLDREHWTQTAIARAAGISQAAVSKALKQDPLDRALETRTDPVYLAGRLAGIAAYLMQLGLAQSSERYMVALYQGGFTWALVERLLHALESEVRAPAVPEAVGTALQETAMRISVYAEAWPPVVPGAERGPATFAHYAQLSALQRNAQ